MTPLSAACAGKAHEVELGMRPGKVSVLSCFIELNLTREWHACDGGSVVDCASGSKTSCLEITWAQNTHVLQQSRWNQALANLFQNF